MIDKRIVLDIGELYSRCAQSRDLSDMLSQIQSWRGQDILLTGEAPPWFCVWLAVRLRDGAGSLSFMYRAKKGNSVEQVIF